MRLLIVDDDPALRALFRATFDVVDVEVEEAESGEAALAAIERARPDAVVLDVHMPGIGGVELCHRIKGDLRLAGLPVVLLSGADAEGGRALVEEAGADAFVLKPFSPLELLDLVERLAGGGVLRRSVPTEGVEPGDEQLLLYARDLRRLLELERGQRVLLHDAYAETVSALASALESKDTGTRAHSQRVQRYAIELALAVGPELAEDPGAEYGFLLHDVGKIGIPDRILQKPGR
ncbi:MAG TPA: response regulator [Gaiellaceae bacterium]|nr:response regulator [Gaiellaceae bacterium]